MPQTRLRRSSRTTLLDQISVIAPSNLRDLLNIREEDRIRPAAAVTLASILEGERNGMTTAEGRAVRVPLVTLMGLTEEAGGDDTIAAAATEETACCVCLVRKKGAAFIPCGHTFCRVCSRELRKVRRSCPLCNCDVVDVLHIF